MRWRVFISVSGFCLATVDLDLGLRPLALGHAALGHQVDGAVDRDPDDAGLAIDPAVAAQRGVLGPAQCPQLGRQVLGRRRGFFRLAQLVELVVHAAAGGGWPRRRGATRPTPKSVTARMFVSRTSYPGPASRAGSWPVRGAICSSCPCPMVRRPPRVRARVRAVFELVGEDLCQQRVVQGEQGPGPAGTGRRPPARGRRCPTIAGTTPQNARRFDAGKAGRISQQSRRRSASTRSTPADPHTAPRAGASRSRNSSRKNGRKKWNRISPRASPHQPPRERRRYQGISSVRLPLQMIRYCENDMYAQSMVKASSRLPRSWNASAGTTRDSGRTPASRAATMTIVARADSDEAHQQHRAVDRRVPLGLDRHRPVDHGERDGQEVERQAGAAERLGPAGGIRLGDLVLPPRAQADQQGQADPDGEVDRRADQEEGDVQVGRLCAAAPRSC